MDTARVGGRAITTDAESADAGVPEDVRHAVMTAVYDELTRWGLERFDVPTMCARHKIDESVVTKYWGDGSRLALEALLYWSNDVLTPPDTGSLRTDLQALATAVAEQVNDTVGRSLLRAMVVDDRAAFADDTRMAFWMRRFAGIRLVFDRAAARGELRDGVDTIAAMQLVLAPINVRALYTREPIADHYCAAIADLAWHAIAKR
ncbi:TetR/AcrR family transcriptional regulator C-terminal ligand-binding domain-containing protein [Mycolicibacterium crocinum]|uniref:TetR/AcrR family transcriptional regulator C-terminal ligand-binding domain-containing protein n=1 Tax=Mycolicibacterium crocinum TaxID=388459 RepID=A0ABY3TIF3_9MYCO|nr:TetR-like C-terminal domain-containing protein [Mycolicibacterium crocinum]ULN39526.1 TetR/AcrR family transcriptional regulator C-terminal ligand-binding domain-containing protein [Mycolicibacterium crocinum]